MLQKNCKALQTWVREEECLVQVTAQSFLGRFGKAAKNMANRLMSDGLVHFIASDAHDPIDRTPVLTEAHRYIENRYSPKRAEQIFVNNPQAVLVGEPLDPFASEPDETTYRSRLFGKRWFTGFHSIQ